VVRCLCENMSKTNSFLGLKNNTLGISPKTVSEI